MESPDGNIDGRVILDYSLPRKKAFDLVGTATSSWQMNPEDEESDWGYELKKKQAGQKNGITGPSDPEDLPHFDSEYNHILPRAQELGSNVFRMSIDFAELCPELGVFDEEKMAHYIRVLARCHALGMEPMITLNHWTLPKSLATYNEHDQIQKGPLEHPEIVDHFAFFINKVADFLFNATKIRASVAGEGYDKSFVDKICDEKLMCRWFVSLNEPMNMVFAPYITGAFPPYQFGSVLKYTKLEAKTKKMHEISYDGLHNKAATTNPHQQTNQINVGMAHALCPNNIPVPIIGELQDYYSNWALAQRMEDGATSDFIGTQVYCRFEMALAMPPHRGSDPRYHSDHPYMGQIYPRGVLEVLSRASKIWPEKPLMLSEFGFADNKDQKRPDWILDTVYYLIEAKKAGINVTGAMLWSLINNFEWAKGMDPSFGLFDHRGQRLKSDNGENDHISSREVWTKATKHLLNPTDAQAMELGLLRLKTNAQLNESTGFQIS